MADNPLGDFFISDADDELLEDDETVVAAVVVPAAEAPRRSGRRPLRAAQAVAAPQPAGAGRAGVRVRDTVAGGALGRRRARSGWPRRSTT